MRSFSLGLKLRGQLLGCAQTGGDLFLGVAVGQLVLEVAAVFAQYVLRLRHAPGFQLRLKAGEKFILGHLLRPPPKASKRCAQS